MPTIEEHRFKLRRRHYLRHATAENFWFDFASRKMGEFVQRYGEDFCLIINGSHTVDDAYVIPYSVARSIFTSAALGRRSRWIGTIVKHELLLVPSHNSLNVSQYHNAFKQLRLQAT